MSAAERLGITDAELVDVLLTEIGDLRMHASQQAEVQKRLVSDAKKGPDYALHFGAQTAFESMEKQLHRIVEEYRP